jgi:DNA-binding GntR family transcriptional regulator
MAIKHPIRSAPTLFFQKATNAFLDYLRQQRKLPTEKVLAQMLNVSRSTLRRIEERAVLQGLIDIQSQQRIRLRRPRRSDFFKLSTTATTQRERVEMFFLRKVAQAKFSPGQPVSERQMALECDTNTITVREALLHLSRYGLISKEVRKRWRVVAITPGAIEELGELRQLLESYALEKAVVRACDDPFWPQLQNLLRECMAFQMDQSGCQESFFSLDLKLHQTLLSAAGNRYINEQFEMLSLMIRFQASQQLIDLGHLKRAHMQHIQLLRLLEKKKKKAALQLLHQHLQMGTHFSLQSLNSSRTFALGSGKG